MGSADSLSGQDLSGMFEAATARLERSARAINSLNVFPVPDGDTGTNMLLTMRAAMAEARRCSESSAQAMAQALARGALTGARGNSGVILSQILRGLARGLAGKDSFDGRALAAALMESSIQAYKGVSKPVEGTILTVIREAATAAQATSSADANEVASILEAAVTEALASVARTPSLLDVLHQAGVVDAGGQGLYVILEGALRYLRSEPAAEEIVELMPAAVVTASIGEEPIYGYCTEFLLQGTDLELEAIREKLVTIGESVLVVGDGATVRAHLHTFDPGAAISYATSLGTLRQVKVENMEDQHQDFIASQEVKPSQPVGRISTIAVVSGSGLSRVFASLGATAIVPGGQTMNPSVQELLQAMGSVPTEEVIILPNNPNILLTAGQAQGLTQKRVAVVPAKTIPQGVVALLAFNPEFNLETNVAAMKEAITTVRSGEITTAVRSMELGDLKVAKGQAIALLDGELALAGDSMAGVLEELLFKMSAPKAELVTIYYGADSSKAEVEEAVESIRHRFPNQEIEIVAGGQPYYNYIVSVE